MLKQQDVQTHRHSARKKEHTGSTRTARTGSGYWVQHSRNLCTEAGGAEKREHHLGVESSPHTHAHTCTHGAPGGSRFHQWPSSRAAPRLAQNFICCNLSPATLLLLRHKHSYSSIYLPSSENHAEPFSLDQRTGAAGPLWLYASLCRCGQGSPPPARWGHRRPKW